MPRHWNNLICLCADPSGHFVEGGLVVCLGANSSAERKESVDEEMHKGKVTHTCWLTELFLALYVWGKGWIFHGIFLKMQNYCKPMLCKLLRDNLFVPEVWSMKLLVGISEGGPQASSPDRTGNPGWCTEAAGKAPWAGSHSGLDPMCVAVSQETGWVGERRQGSGSPTHSSTCSMCLWASVSPMGTTVYQHQRNMLNSEWDHGDKLPRPSGLSLLYLTLHISTDRPTDFGSFYLLIYFKIYF